MKFLRNITACTNNLNKLARRSLSIGICVEKVSKHFHALRSTYYIEAEISGPHVSAIDGYWTSDFLISLYSAQIVFHIWTRTFIILAFYMSA